MVNSRFDRCSYFGATVIISEREGMRRALFRLYVMHTAFRIHPYHHEVIGDMADLRAITREDLYDHYNAFYVPSNAVIAVAGDFDTKTMLARIKELFEPIPARSEPARLAREEPPQNGEIRLSVEGPGETTYVQVCYRSLMQRIRLLPIKRADSLLAGSEQSQHVVAHLQ